LSNEKRDIINLIVKFWGQGCVEEQTLRNPTFRHAGGVVPYNGECSLSNPLRFMQPVCYTTIMWGRFVNRPYENSQLSIINYLRSDYK